MYLFTANQSIHCAVVPRVSVIIPTYNRRGYLRQAVDSVLAQTRPDFEVLVVDDGSTDDTPRVIASMADPRLRCLWQANAGRSAARNRGMAAARGEFIAFLDDDDQYLPHKLAAQVAFLDEHGDVDLVGAGVEIVDAQGKSLRTWRTWLDQPVLTLETCLYACPLPTCSVLLRRAMLARLDHWFDPAQALAEDTDFFLRLLLAGGRMAWLPEIVSTYRQHSGSSQHDGAQYAASYDYLLNKLFARPDLPGHVRAERDRLCARRYLTGACHCYAAGQVAEAQATLEKALALQPAWADGPQPELAVHIAAFAASPSMAGRSPEAYVNGAFDQLPASLHAFRRWRGHTLSLAYMQRVFAAQASGGQPALADWLAGIRHDPRWLRNRGIWSILAHDILGIMPGRRRGSASGKLAS